LFDFGVATDKPGEAPHGGRVKPGSQRARSGERVDLYGVRQALDGDRPPGHNLDITLRELQGRGSEQDGARRRHLLHSGGQVRRLADRRVIHVQV
jgi:hypothetical protein